MAVSLPYAVFRVHGADAQVFLQGQLTCDVRGLVPGEWRRGGFCLPDGKVLAVFWLQCQGDGYVLALPADLADGVMKRLRMFVLRSKVAVEACADGLFAVPCANARGFTLHCGAAPLQAFDAEDYFSLCIRAGIAEVFAPTSGEFLPQMLALAEIGALSFDKGCYVGQEAVARLQYKGSNRRVLACARAALAQGVPAGAALWQGGLRAGTVLLAARDGVQAVVQAVVQGRFLASALFPAGSDVPLYFYQGE